MSKKKLPKKERRDKPYNVSGGGVWGVFRAGCSMDVPQGEERKRTGKREKATRTYPTEEAPNMGKVVDVP